MPAGITKGLNHQIRGTVDNRRLAVEVISRGDKGPQLDNPRHPVKVTVTGDFQIGYQIDGTDTDLDQFEDTSVSGDRTLILSEPTVSQMKTCLWVP